MWRMFKFIDPSPDWCRCYRAYIISPAVCDRVLFCTAKMTFLSDMRVVNKLTGVPFLQR